MNRIPIPNTALAVSPVTLGTMTFGSPVGFDDAVDLTRYAAQQGINLFDTANMYEGYNRYAGSSGGVAEEILGAAFAKNRETVVLATKLGMKVGEQPEDEGTSAAAIQKQLPKSLERLGTDYVDIYYLHKPGPAEELPGTLKELAHAIRQGQVRHYGVSNYSAAELRLLLDTADELDLPHPVICQPPLSLLKQDALAELIPLCAAEGIAVTPYQIYQGGLLTGKYKRGAALPQGSRGAEKPEWMWAMDDALFDKLEAYERDARAEGLDLAGYALCWALRQPAVVSAIVGVKTRQQVDGAIAAAESCRA